MTDEAELLQRLRNREKNSIDEAIQIYTPYLSTVLYHMAGNSLPKEDIEEIVADVFYCTLEECRENRFTERYITVISCCRCPEFCSERINRKRIHTFLEDIELSDGKISLKRIFITIMYGKQL